jgi:hypothetical protein
MGVKGGKMMNLLDAGPSKEGHGLQRWPANRSRDECTNWGLVDLATLAMVYNHLPSIIGTNPNRLY